MIDLLLMFALAGPLPAYATPHWGVALSIPSPPKPCSEQCPPHLCIKDFSKVIEWWDSNGEHYICSQYDCLCYHPEPVPGIWIDWCMICTPVE